MKEYSCHALPRVAEGIAQPIARSIFKSDSYTSNAIEGNTLTQMETSIVIEKGITVSSKPLKDHLEAVDHYNALRYVRGLAQQGTALSEGDVRNLQRLVVQRSNPEIDGRYADGVRHTPTEAGRHTFPDPAEVPPLMSDFAAWLRTSHNTPGTAFSAHRRLFEIHPFNDGNGRTARLLMNLVLIRGGYPPVAVPKTGSNTFAVWRRNRPEAAAAA